MSINPKQGIVARQPPDGDHVFWFSGYDTATESESGFSINRSDMNHGHEVIVVDMLAEFPYPSVLNRVIVLKSEPLGK